MAAVGCCATTVTGAGVDGTTSRAITSVGAGSATGEATSTATGVSDGCGGEVGTSKEATVAVADTAVLAGAGSTVPALCRGENKEALPAPRTSSATSAIAR